MTAPRSSSSRNSPSRLILTGSSSSRNSPSRLILTAVAVVSLIVTLSTTRQYCSIKSITDLIQQPYNGNAVNSHDNNSFTTSLGSYEALSANMASVKKEQRIVILAGPHKTGSTSIQNNFHEWTGEKNYLLKQWAWPVPLLVTKYESQDPTHWLWNPSKGFYALAELLRDEEKYKLTDRLLFRNNTKEEILFQYELEFYKAWVFGYSLIIGTEAFDNAIKDDDGLDMIDRLLDLMPLLDEEEEFDISRITVVVTYRSPRVKHLISIWHETRKQNQTFKQWILETHNKLGAIDTLGLLELFLQKGLKVVLADLHGISGEGYDISNVIACDVLNATCTDDMKLIGSDPPLVMNTKQNFSGEIDLTDDQLDSMDEIIQRYDCKYLDMMHKYIDSDQLMTIYPTTILKVMDSCKKKENSAIKLRSEMKERMVCIAAEGEWGEGCRLANGTKLHIH